MWFASALFTVIFMLMIWSPRLSGGSGSSNTCLARTINRSSSSFNVRCISRTNFCRDAWTAEEVALIFIAGPGGPRRPGQHRESDDGGRDRREPSAPANRIEGQGDPRHGSGDARETIRTSGRSSESPFWVRGHRERRKEYAARSPLIDGQIAIFDREGQHGHRGAVIAASGAIIRLSPRARPTGSRLTGMTATIHQCTHGRTGSQRPGEFAMDSDIIGSPRRLRGRAIRGDGRSAHSALHQAVILRTLGDADIRLIPDGASLGRAGSTRPPDRR